MAEKMAAGEQAVAVALVMGKTTVGEDAGAAFGEEAVAGTNVSGGQGRRRRRVWRPAASRAAVWVRVFECCPCDLGCVGDILWSVCHVGPPTCLP
jgi:hypothetical protein